MLRKELSLFLVYVIALHPTLSLATPPKIPGFYGAIPNRTTPVTLPVLLPGGSLQGVGSVTTNVSTNHMIVNQTASQAIIDWQSFNIGANAWTQFDQKGNKNWVALNRIHDLDPSQIYGKLTADGKIYLINQNGILFGPGSQVNVHTLVASSLDLKNEDFMKGAWNFQGTPGTTPGVVSNHGTISTDDLGSVFLLGSQVENYGSINAPVGQIGLVAGTDVELKNDPTGARSALIVNVKDGAGSATNGEGGSMTADTGLVGMYGKEVVQNGLIRSVTAVRKNGQIELFASDKVTLGANSLTESPISDSSETVDGSFAFNGGKITVAGLDPAHPDLPQIPANQIELYGAIEAPSGTVAMQADQRIYLDKGSSINVAGSWMDKPASANAATATLNSVTLNDDYGQKGGVLQGQTVTVDPTSGSAVGNIQDSLKVGDKTALERSIQGGTIELQVKSGDLIAKEGALLDFSGGGINYGLGAYATTKLLAGNTVYDISNAPEWVRYSKVLGDQKTFSKKFGKTGEYVGLYFGGGASVQDLKPGFVQGADAGSLSVAAPHVVLDAKLDGSATAGVYQTNISRAASSIAAGTEMPLGGTLTVGATYSGTSSDLAVGSIVVKSDSDAVTGTSATLPINPAAVSSLSARNLSGSGLSTVSLNANSGITIEGGAAVSLKQGGTFTANSRRIDDQGVITAPGGKVTLITSDNVTSNSQNPVAQSLTLGQRSRIDVAGQKIDNSLTGKGAAVILASGVTAGGTVSLQDVSIGGNGVLVDAGATLDVSGGYRIDAKGKVTGGDAGLLNVEGHTVVLDGTLQGLALPGSKGGKLSLHADEIDVLAATSAPLTATDASQIPADRVGTLLLGAHQLDDTGFSQIELKSEKDISFKAQFSPSMTKMAAPVTAKGERTGQLAVNSAIFGSDPLSPDYVGATSVTASTGILFPRAANDTREYTPQITVATGAGIKVAPGGTVTLQADNINMLGTITAQSGQVSLTATNGDVNLVSAKDGATGQILASGYVKPNAGVLAGGLAADPLPLAGGSVSLTASGTLNMKYQQPGGTEFAFSNINISGAAPVATQVRKADGTVSTVAVGSDAGSLSLSYGNNLNFGKLNAQGSAPGAKGGTLTVATSQDLVVTTSGNQTVVNDPALSQRSVYLDWLGKCGFDALTLKSSTGLDLAGGFTYQANRSLSLDAPVIKGDGTAQTLSSPWITVQNSNTGTNPLAGNGTGGTGELKLQGQWIDLKGAVQLSGFKNVSFAAQNDIRLSDLQYGANKSWQGSLALSGDLTLMANRVYPTTLADFTIDAASYKDASGNTLGGQVSVLPNSTPAPNETVLSAGGKLTINADTGIDVKGVIDAPMGSIELDAPNGRVYLDDKSVLSTAGSVPVPYGALDDVFWTYLSRSSVNNVTTPVASAPAKSVTINGKEVITRDGSTIDVSGGGSVFAYQFMKGTEGTVDPFTVKGRYIIVPDQSVSLPGNAIYLSGGNGLKAGLYSILPEQYAFLPGAMVLTDLGTPAVPGTSQRSAEGYPVVTGYATVNGTNVGSPLLKNFSIRTAADVRKEGHFGTEELTAGDAGAVTLHGSTTIINGDIKAAALPDYNGGSMDLSGRNVTVTAAAGASLPQDFSFGSAVPADQEGTLQLAASAVSGKGLDKLSLGDRNTATVTVQGGSTLDVHNVSISAQNSISVEAGAQIQAIAPKDGTGTVSFTAPQGSVSVASGAVVHATDSVTLDAAAVHLQGSLSADQGQLNLVSDNIYFVSDAFQAANPGVVAANSGLSISNATWSGFSGFSDVTLKSGSDIAFQGDFDLKKPNRTDPLDRLDQLTMDAARIVGAGGSTGTTIDAKSISLQNSGTSPAAPAAGAVSNSVTFTADQISVGRGNVQVAGFGQVNLNSTHDLVLKGDGSLTVDKDLNVSAARITTASAVNTSGDGSASYIPANFTLDASHGKVVLVNSGQAAGTATTPGGALTIKAQGVDDGAVIELPSGSVTISTGASGTDGGIVMRNGASILAKGSSTPGIDPKVSDYLPAGSVTLATATAPITLESGSAIDVSAAGTGDAGSVTLQALNGGVKLDGTLTGTATAGKGGSLTLATDTLDVVNGENRFGALAAKLKTGGFHGDLDLRAATGDVTIDPPAAVDSIVPSAVSAANFRLSADSGSITLNGKIDVSGVQKGGTAQLSAGKSLTLASGSAIDASGTGSGASGGDVLLGIAAGSGGTLNMAAGSTVDVSGNGVKGGTVTFRAPQKGVTDVAMSLNGSVKGASLVVADAVRAYDKTGQNTIGSADFTGWQNAAASFMTGVTWSSGLVLDPGTDFSLIPGVEVTSTGNLTVNSPLNLTSARFGSAADVPGELTVRAAGNLAINGGIVDNPAAGRSWGINLAAGADLGSADYLAVNSTRQGNLTVADGVGVFSKSAPVRFASGGDTTMNQAATVGNGLPLSLGTGSGAVTGRVGGDLLLNGGVIQSATGDIDLKVGGNLYLKTKSTTLGSVRTTGVAPADPSEYWNYGQGGSIDLTVGGSVRGGLEVNQWDHLNDAYGDGSLYLWSASNGQNDVLPTAGIATLGGGDVTIRTGGSFSGQSGTFGTGNLSIQAGGDIKNAHFLVKDGKGELNSMGSIGNFGSSDYLVLDAFNARLKLAAQGDIELGTVLNPTLVREITPGDVMPWSLQYGVGTSADSVSSVSLSAASGDVTIFGTQQKGTVSPAAAILPADLKVYAGHDINMQAPQLILAPSPYGNLQLSAKNDITGVQGSPTYLYLSDMDPQAVYGDHPDFYVGQLTTSHSATLLHNDDPNPVQISAGGNIENLQLHLPKQTRITAGGDIKDIYYSSQNLQADDVSEIVAKGNITFSNQPGQASGNTGIDQAGPGSLLVEAGDSIDLGTTKGIKSNGNFIDGTSNRALGNDGAALIVVAGTTGDAADPTKTETVSSFDPKKEIDRVNKFFKGTTDANGALVEKGLQQYGIEYSLHLAQGESALADSSVAEARVKQITPFFGGPVNIGTGNIRMTSSQISTVSGKDDISMVARGQIDVGKTTFDQKTESTGIFTAAGGAINSFSGGDLNVNESRMMTFMGGDITIWSDRGNINAGRGSSTTINTAPPKLVEQADGSFQLVFQPPAVGSGIRAVTFDPDGEGPLTAPKAGNIYATAPEGFIDAGEAGMAGSTFMLGARDGIKSPGNISAGLVGSVGVPSTSEGTASIGSLGGSGALTASSNTLDQSAALTQVSKLAPSTDLADDFVAKWLDVKVLDFDDDQPQQDKKKHEK